MDQTRNMPLFSTIAGISGPFPASLETLNTFHDGWPRTIPFENVDVLLNRQLSIELEDITDKLLHKRRGGYCFEHNLLLKQILEEVGFAVSHHLARVVWGQDELTSASQTHMLLIVTLEGSKYLLDVGLGGVSLITPLRLEESEQKGFVLERIDNVQWLLSLNGQDGKRLMYLFEKRPCEPADVLVASHFVAAYESSLFRHNLMMTTLCNGEQYNLFNKHLTIHTGMKTEQQAETYDAFFHMVSAFYSRLGVLSCEDMQAIFDKINNR